MSDVLVRKSRFRYIGARPDSAEQCVLEDTTVFGEWPAWLWTLPGHRRSQNKDGTYAVHAFRAGTLGVTSERACLSLDGTPVALRFEFLGSEDRVLDATFAVTNQSVRVPPQALACRVMSDKDARELVYLPVPRNETRELLAHISVPRVTL